MSKTWHGGKGDRPRPVDRVRYVRNWERIFGPKRVDDEVVCPHCGQIVGSRRLNDDDYIDYCEHCDRVVEGETK